MIDQMIYLNYETVNLCKGNNQHHPSVSRRDKTALMDVSDSFLHAILGFMRAMLLLVAVSD